jgi:putative Mn2+ efflux pump MntP
MLGARMVVNGFTVKEVAKQKAAAHSFWLLELTGIATSIDAMAVGAGLAFVDVNIYSTAAAIGLATMAMVAVGVMLGRVMGHVVGRRAEMVGGVVLIGIGGTIVAKHLKIFG